MADLLTPLIEKVQALEKLYHQRIAELEAKYEVLSSIFSANTSQHSEIVSAVAPETDNSHAENSNELHAASE